MKKSFKINIEQSVIADLKSRIANTRWADEIENSKWEYGTNKTYYAYSVPEIILYKSFQL